MVKIGDYFRFNYNKNNYWIGRITHIEGELFDVHIIYDTDECESSNVKGKYFNQQIIMKGVEIIDKNTNIKDYIFMEEL